MRDRFVFQLNSATQTVVVQMQIDPQQYNQKLMHDSFVATGCYEPNTTKYIVETLKDGDTFIDIGAHIGIFTLITSVLVGPSGRVFAFEPEPNNFRHLLEHLELNKCSNVFPIHAAVSDRTGTDRLQINADCDGGHSFYDISLHPLAVKAKEDVKSVRVPMVTLQKFFEYEGRVRIIKIDAEGSEFRILKGHSDWLKKVGFPDIILEINRFALEQMGTSAEELIDYLAKINYVSHSIEGEANIDGAGVFNLLFKHSP